MMRCSLLPCGGRSGDRLGDENAVAGDGKGACHARASKGTATCACCEAHLHHATWLLGWWQVSLASDGDCDAHRKKYCQRDAGNPTSRCRYDAHGGGNVSSAGDWGARCKAAASRRSRQSATPASAAATPPDPPASSCALAPLPGCQAPTQRRRSPARWITASSAARGNSEFRSWESARTIHGLEV